MKDSGYYKIRKLLEANIKFLQYIAYVKAPENFFEEEKFLSYCMNIAVVPTNVAQPEIVLNTKMAKVTTKIKYTLSEI